MLIRDGFPGQRLRVLPRPRVAEALAAPITRRMLVTDAGHFPHAAAHGRDRPRGAEEVVVILCTGGAGRLEVRGDEHPMAPGVVAVIPRGEPHRYRADPRDPWTIWWMHVTGGDADDLAAAITRPSDDFAPVLQVHDPYAAKSALEHALVSLERDETVASLVSASGAAWGLLAQLAADRARGANQAGDPILAAQDYLRENLETTTGVAELAAIAGLSTSHFSARFRQASGMGVVEYHKRLRSARARELLITTEATVADIGRAVGYEDAFYFSRQFRAINGTSPSGYRAAFRDRSRPHD
ncbi:AraC family transcriptional regulator [Herbiconiux sp. CPCC 205716]|uniref:AraC family transcriptional regulator n=1 Tax=Herbiconiux gentiana TaxID=2970912 RepID=A0ABT2GDG9_9MICO|nr:AraC family transcriptional regulator [Herbiconiux gentiana]MCS5714277.1 AraC family transcriptional regulator [Herbiconiux gentiana]